MLSIKRATVQDASAITEIKIKAYNKEINAYLGRDGGPPGYNQVDSEIEIIHNLIAYKIMLDQQIIGAFFLIPIEEMIMGFEDFVIDPNFQGLGYGYQTLQLVEESYPTIKEWQLSTPTFSVGNQHLYEKFGYTEISRQDDEIQYRKVIH